MAIIFLNLVFLIEILLLNGDVTQVNCHETQLAFDSSDWSITDLFTDIISADEFSTQDTHVHHLQKRQTFRVTEGSGTSCVELGCNADSEECMEEELECKCKTGFSSFILGETCTDKNECDSTNTCSDPNSKCVNNVGSFSCECKAGYQLNGDDSCENVNECATSPCDSNASCEDTIGSFTCHCNEGFSGDGFTCTDDNECEQSPYPCAPNSNCENYPGTYTCMCINDFIGDGTTCTACRLSKIPIFLSADIVDDTTYTISMFLRDLHTFENGVNLRVQEIDGTFVTETIITNDGEVTLTIPGATADTPYLFSMKENNIQCSSYSSPSVFRTKRRIVVVTLTIVATFFPAYNSLYSPQSLLLITQIRQNSVAGVSINIIAFISGSVKAVIEVSNKTEGAEEIKEIASANDIINVDNTTLNVSAELTPVESVNPAPAGAEIFSISNTSLRIQWDSYSNASTCLITDINNNSTKYSVINDDSLVIGDLQDGTVYAFELQCIIKNGTVPGFSLPVILLGSTLPAPTTNLQIQPVDANSLDVMFDSIADGSYIVKVFNNATKEEVSSNVYDNTNEISITTVSVIVQGLEANTAYKICVTNGVNLRNKTVTSLEACSTALSGPNTPVLSIKSNTQDGTEIGWNSDDNVDLYEYRAVNIDGSTIAGTTTETSIAFNDNQFILGSSYTYYVTAINSFDVKSAEASLSQESAPTRSFNFEGKLTSVYTYNNNLADTSSTEFNDLSSLVINSTTSLSNLNTTLTVVKFNQGSVVARIVAETTSPATTSANVYVAMEEFAIFESVEEGFNNCLESPCSSNGVCNKTGDSTHTCKCKVGYTGNGVACADVNECDDNPCTSNAECKNNAGSYECTCTTGYSGDGNIECQNINECNTTNDCHTKGDCADTPGSYTCACKVGFSGDGKTCEDIIECDVSSPCAEHAACANTIGSFVCTCNVGYEGNAIDQCFDLNECSQPSVCVGANKKCLNNPGSFTCPCNTGFHGGDNNTDCVDTNECDSNPCDSLAYCLNSVGSYACLCPTGYTGSGIGAGTCVDKNECTGTTVQCPVTSTCENTQGSFECNCHTNYIKSGSLCLLAPQQLEINVNVTYQSGLQHSTDIAFLQLAIVMTENLKLKFAGFEFDDYSFHEIPDVTPIVALRFTATATDESVRFETFLDGFDQTKGDPYIFLTTPTTVLNQCVLPNECPEKSTCVFDSTVQCVCDVGFDGSDCATDINECTSTNNCDENASCSNNVGSYTCTCNDGFFGSGFVCGGVACSPGQCSQFAECVENGGGTDCVCTEGYEGNGSTCTDVNECEDNTFTCGSNEACLNIEGSYNCECTDGYQRNTLTSTCVEINECLSNPCSENAQCTDQIGGFQCTCNDGFTGSGANCADVNECTGANNCDLNADCTNNQGSYDCSCKAGFEGDGESCMELNECESNPCDGTTSDCVDEVNSFSCECKPGYEQQGEACVNIDECAFGECVRPYVCADNPGSFVCICPWGYEVKDGECVDINECLQNICGDDATCTNLPGIYICACNTGFNGNQTIGCTDINECDTVTCVDNSNCVNEPGSYTCECVTGYQKNSQSDCIDVNECDENPVPCAANAVCGNIAGSHTCECLDGFLGDGFAECAASLRVQATMNSSFVFTSALKNPNSQEYRDLETTIITQLKLAGFKHAKVVGFYEGSVIADLLVVTQTPGATAQDVKVLIENDDGTSALFPVVSDVIDACLDNPCNNNANCQTFNDAPVCTCSSGYTGDGQTCVQLDPCFANPCSANEACTTTDVSYTCDCNTGFTNHSGSGCVDQCSADVGYCLNGATCQQTSGTGDPACTCSSNFSGDRCDLSSLTWRLTIAFGVLAGVLFIVLLVAITVYCIRRKRGGGDLYNA